MSALPMTYTSKLVHALDSQVVQSKIFEIVIEPVFDKFTVEFGKAVGVKVSELLSRRTED